MPARKFTAAAAAALALLALTAPARAAIVPVGSWSENIDLNFGDGYTATGRIGGLIVTYTGASPNSVSYFLSSGPSLYLDGTPVPTVFNPDESGNPSGDPAYYASSFCPPCIAFGYSANQLPTNVSDFYLTGGGSGAVSGEVTGTSYTETLPPLSPTPLPAALPLFGSALLALAGFAAWSRRSARG